MNVTSNDRRRTALWIVERLRAAGHTAYFAGGCVRDRLLGREPKDYDIATDAPPKEVEKLFPRSRRVGAKFGVMLVRKWRQDVEVATFRSDGDYSDGRHPDSVTFGTEREDALRRDFTINGLFFDPIDERLIDHVGGKADLEAGVLRTIGNPDRRFEEDHLRMLRAVRFAARFGFPIEPPTQQAIVRQAECLQRISAERIWLELEMILTEPTRAVGWSLLIATGLRRHLAASWASDAAEDDRVGRRLLALPEGYVDSALALATVLSHHSSRSVQTICRELRLSNRLTRDALWLVESLVSVGAGRPLELADLKMLMAHDAWPMLPDLFRAELAATDGSRAPLDELERRANAIAPEAVSPPPLLTGDDLQAMDVSSGPKMGTLLCALRRAQLNEEISTRPEAVAFARRRMDDG